MDAAETARVYAFCCTTWRQRPSEAELSAWKLVLADTAVDAGMGAAIALARTGREFMPAPGLLVVQAAGNSQPGQVIAVGDHRFLPGTGWVGGNVPPGSGPGALAEPAETAGGASVVRAIRSARSALQRGKDAPGES